jgi:hypothetical protein
VSNRIYGPEIAELAETLVRQGPPVEPGRATWTLHTLAHTITTHCEHITRISHETVRRLLQQRHITYRQAKEWLTSPDPLYAVRKHQRDRLLRLARTAPDGVAIWLDQSWFVRWPYRYWKWSTADELPRVPKRWQEKVDTTALYATLDDETQQPFLHWIEDQPNSEETIKFLESLMAHWTQQHKRFVALFWDRASWHTSKRTRHWIRDYNRRAKKENLARLIICRLPTRSPWLMPLEAIFGWVKHHVLGARCFEQIADLKAAVEFAFKQRVADAKVRRDRAWATALSTSAQKSTSVV